MFIFLFPRNQYLNVYVSYQQVIWNSPDWVCFICYSNWWVISLSLFWPMNFLSPFLPVFSPILMGRNYRCLAAGWDQPTIPSQVPYQLVFYQSWNELLPLLLTMMIDSRKFHVESNTMLTLIFFLSQYSFNCGMASNACDNNCNGEERIKTQNDLDNNWN